MLFMTAKNIFSIRKGKKDLFYLFLLLDCICATVIGQCQLPVFIGLTINLIMEILLIHYVCQGEKKNKILLVLCYDIGIMCVDFVVFMVAQTLFHINTDAITDSNFENSVLSIMSKSIVCLVLLFIVSWYNKQEKKRYFDVVPIIYIVPIMSIIVLCIMFDYSLNIKLTFYKNVLIYIAMVFVLLLNVFLLYICEMLQENQEQKLHMRLMQQEIECFEEIKKSYEQIKMVKHDYDKQINVMSALLQKKEYDKLVEFFGSEFELNRFNVIENYTNNTVFDVIINQKRNIAAKQDIQFFVETEKIERNALNPFHICVLLGNVLDNAIEGTQRYMQENDNAYGFVRLKIVNSNKINGNSILISVTNSCCSNVDETISSKSNQDTHGYGIKNIKTAVKKMGGISSTGVENNEFCFVAKIPAK